MIPSWHSYLRPEVACNVLRGLSEREKGRRSIVTHDLLQLVDLFRDVAKSGLHTESSSSSSKPARVRACIVGREASGAALRV